MHEDGSLLGLPVWPAKQWNGAWIDNQQSQTSISGLLHFVFPERTTQRRGRRAAWQEIRQLEDRKSGEEVPPPPVKGKPTAVTQTEDVKSGAIEARQLIFTELPPKKETAQQEYLFKYVLAMDSALY